MKFKCYTIRKKFVKKDVENTADEAVAVKELISPSKRIIRVTSVFRLYRAQRLFEKQRFEVTPHKVDYKIGGYSTVSILNFVPNASYLQLTDT